ncbi:Rmf/CrpP fold protein [Streptomyces sp. NPDC048506]|uniref:Rmf/CrpP fold protein n=1 Tax=Streptomyces sp. NPDC048506 TaxID=3155028 RepID=UPI00343FD8E2
MSAHACQEQAPTAPGVHPMNDTSTSSTPAAAPQGAPLTACPYPRASTLRTAWIRGYAETCPVSAQPETAE